MGKTPVRGFVSVVVVESRERERGVSTEYNEMALKVPSQFDGMRDELEGIENTPLPAMLSCLALGIPWES